MAFERRGRVRVDTDQEGSAPSLSPEKQEARAKNVLLYQLSRSAKSKEECRRILAKRGIDEAIAEKVLDRFEEAQIIDDAMFARVFTNAKVKTNGLAKGAIARQLREKGVANEHVESALQEFDAESETARATALAIHRIARMSGLEKDVMVRRLSGYLGRKGYSGGAVSSAIKAALAEAVKSEV